tara:strand:- start:38 stop:253 length:216 start_codon:yes stop_codon:yes gene_type:complete
MESYLERRKEDLKKSPKKNANNLNSLIQEYCLKRGQFNPKKPSPNRFCNKLEYRMKSYYNTLYTLSSSPPK